MLFADDTLIYKAIKSRQDELEFQSNLNTIATWSDFNGMRLNTSKSRIMLMTRVKKHVVLPQYSFHDQQIPVASTYKYLGVYINNHLNWNDHVNAVVAKAKRTLGFIWQIGGTSSRSLFSLYQSLVIPVLEYGLPA